MKECFLVIAAEEAGKLSALVKKVEKRGFRVVGKLVGKPHYSTLKAGAEYLSQKYNGSLDFYLIATPTSQSMAKSINRLLREQIPILTIS